MPGLQFIAGEGGPPPDLPPHVVAAQREAFWADFDELSRDPDRRQYVRPRIPHEFGDDGDMELTDWDVVPYVLVRGGQTPSGELQWHRFELTMTGINEWSANRDDCWQWNLGRPNGEAR